jgi:hypothetical protein
MGMVCRLVAAIVFELLLFHRGTFGWCPAILAHLVVLVSDFQSDRVRLAAQVVCSLPATVALNRLVSLLAALEVGANQRCILLR